MQRFLFRIFGLRVATLFGGISLLSAAVLAALYLTASYAVQSYVSEQIGKIPWDVTVGQRDRVKTYNEFQQHLRSTPGVKRVEALGLLRLMNSGTAVQVDVDGKPLPVRWLVIAASSKPDLLPPGLQARTGGGDTLIRAALVGARDAMTGSPIEVGAGATLKLRKVHAHAEEEPSHDHGHQEDATMDVASDAPDVLFEAKLMKPVEVERQELNKWMLRNVGSMSYLPEQSIVVVVPMERFAQTADLFDRTFGASAGVHGATSAPPYIPEMTHLVSLDRDRWITPWQFESSLKALSDLQQKLLDDVRELTIFSYVSSDTFATLNRMYQVNKLIGAVTLLIAIPLLWLGWAVAKMLSGLLLMNERRLIGLAVIRGVPTRLIGRSLLTALILGGLGGSLLGLLLGIGTTIAGQSLLGEPVPPASIVLRGVAYFGIFAVLAITIAVVTGWSMIRRVRQMSPREAVAYVSSAEADTRSDAPSPLYIAASVTLLLLGLYKFIAWTSGMSLFADQETPLSSARQILLLLDAALNFVAVPFLLFGVAGLLRWRTRWIQYVLSAITAPVAGRLRWFVAEHMAINRERVAGTLFIAALAMSLALLPKVAADTFNDRMWRGVDAAIGGDVQVEYGAGDLGAGAESLMTVRDHQAVFGAKLASIEAAMRAHGHVADVTVMEQFIAPDVYIPNQQGLLIDLLRSPDEYLKLVYSEQRLGLSQPFDQVIRSSANGTLTASAGLLNLREIPLGRDVALGFDGERPVTAKFQGVLAFLPGQPSIDVAQREGYAAAEVDYINYLLGSDARAISTISAFERGPLSRMKLLPSRVVFLVRMQGGVNEQQIQQLVKALPVKPQDVRWKAEERRRLSRDMFISLALENMKVFMVGGLILSIAGVVVVGLANFLSERRTLSLLRLRGLPAATVLRVSLSIFLGPVFAGILLGIILGILAGYGTSEAVWQLPRIYGVAGLLSSKIAVSGGAAAIVLAFSATLLLVALAFALWPFRRTANENVRKS